MVVHNWKNPNSIVNEKLECGFRNPHSSLCFLNTQSDHVIFQAPAADQASLRVVRPAIDLQGHLGMSLQLFALTDQDQVAGPMATTNMGVSLRA